MKEALNEQFGTAAEFEDTKGGMFLWVKLPDNVDTMKLYQPALAAGVAINPGPEWSVDKAALQKPDAAVFRRPDPRRNPPGHRGAGGGLPQGVRRAGAHRQRRAAIDRINVAPARRRNCSWAPSQAGPASDRVQFSPAQIRPPSTQPLISSMPAGVTAIFES